MLGKINSLHIKLSPTFLNYIPRRGYKDKNIWKCLGIDCQK
jgi:hypothetical protein